MRTSASHGMAFVVARSAKNFTTALPDQFIGLLNNNSGNATNHLFAVEFDTILNPEFNDMSDNHVGIDVNGLESMDADNAGYYDDTTGSSFRNLSLISRKAMQVWVDFDGQTMQQVNVTMAPLQLLRPKKPLLSTIIVNLSSVIDDTAYMNGAAPSLNISSLPSLPATFPNKPKSKTLEIELLMTASAVLVFAGKTPHRLRGSQGRVGVQGRSAGVVQDDGGRGEEGGILRRSSGARARLRRPPTCSLSACSCLRSRIAPDEYQDVLLLDWVRDHQRQGTALDTMDSRLGGIYDADEARLALNLGLMCAHPGADTRPGMRKVVQLLTAGRRPPYTGGDDAGAE
ncbi:hypothetical protein QOZ80_7AG0569050 [Eleusine coracana subsp. coracana]|nr:hypothetical protein QOZ80_7AG0569050 [Eleusine coracana subsp. coracana]